MVSERNGGVAGATVHVLFTTGTIGGLGDGQLLERFTAREGVAASLAFAALVERHGPMVFRVCRGVLHDIHDAEDAFQATFLILARRANSIRRRESLGPWLYGVAHHVASTARAAAARRRAHELRAAKTRPLATSATAWDDFGPVVYEELGRLPERYRAAVVLCCLEGLTQQQAAQQLGWPLGTVQSRLARGRERLRARLTRRGLAPSAAVLSAQVGTVPAALADSTARLAMAKEVGSVPVMTLADKVATMMFLNKLRTAGVAALLAAGLIASGAAVSRDQDARPEPDKEASAEAKPSPTAVVPTSAGPLTITGTVRMPDGSPASGATVRKVNTGSSERAIVVRANKAGRFQIQDVFGDGIPLHASSADGSYQAFFRMPAGAVRTSVADPVGLKLAPAITHDVIVVSQGRPVNGAHVAAIGAGFEVQGIAGEDGKARLRFPAGGKPLFVVAWHPELGADGVSDFPDRPGGDATRLSLLPTKPHKIRVVDVDGEGVGGLELGVNFNAGNGHSIIADAIQAAHVRTDADGTATVPWAPREKLQSVEVVIVGTDWKVDETDRTGRTTGTTTVRTRREHPVEGRLVMPGGESAEGILITGFGFGPGNNGHVPIARARRDGSFTFRVPSEHGYVLGIDDLKWASDPWGGVILGKGTSKPAEITLKVYPATTVTARVTRGPGREPVANAWVQVSNNGRVSWLDARGQKRNGVGGVQSWLTTDARGEARVGLGKGEHEITLSMGSWNEERTVKVSSAEPVAVEFHRTWRDDRKVAGRLVRNGVPYSPSSALMSLAWSPQGRSIPQPFKPVVHPDGTYEAAFDAETLTLFFFDREKGLAGYAVARPGETSLAIPLEGAAAESGVLADENGRPMADRTLEFHVKTLFRDPIAARKTDSAGRFRFEGVPAGVPLQLTIRDESERPDYFLFDGDRLFKPGEVREGVQVKPRRVDASVPAAAGAPAPLARTLEKLCRDAGVCHMHVLLALQGDQSGNVITATGQWLDYDRAQAVLGYLALPVETERLKGESAVIARHGWPVPAPGEVVLVALDGAQKTIATKRVVTRSIDAAVSSGDEFIKQNRPPSRDGLAMRDAARKEARASGRRVWIVEGGPRCGPCFRLARWLEEQRATLEKDYVIVEVMDGIDGRADEAFAELPRKPGDGVPWFAITEPDGTVLATSTGPLGNVGFPSSVEEVRHVRQMIERTTKRLEPDEVDGLIKSLSPER